MKILLINSNPVVSRLTALSARKESIQIDEVQEINEVDNSKYDIIFVDADSWNNELESAISKDIKSQKRVLFYGQDDTNSKENFDLSILKPFLPSEVSAVIRSVEENSSKESDNNSLELKEDSTLNLLDTPVNKKDEKIEDKKDDFLLSLDDDIFLDEKLPKYNKKEEEEEDLFAELKDTSKNFDKKLEESFPSKSEDELFNLDLSDDALEKEFTLLDNKSTTKKEVEEDDLFDFDFDFDKKDEIDLNLDVLSEDKPKVEKVIEQKEIKVKKEEIKREEIKKEAEVKEKIEFKKEEIIEMPMKKETNVETKILDKSEVLNIKDILENDTDSNSLELEDLMTPAVQMISTTPENKKKEKKRKIKKVEESPSIQSDEVLEALTSLPLDTLKRLLSGATVKISIKFPKVK